MIKYFAALIFLVLGLGIVSAQEKTDKIHMSVQRKVPFTASFPGSGNTQIAMPNSLDLIISLENQGPTLQKEGKIVYVIFVNTRTAGRNKLTGEVTVDQLVQGQNKTFLAHASSLVSSGAPELDSTFDPIIGWWVKLIVDGKTVAEVKKPKMVEEWFDTVREYRR